MALRVMRARSLVFHELSVCCWTLGSLGNVETFVLRQTSILGLRNSKDMILNLLLRAPLSLLA